MDFRSGVTRGCIANDRLYRSCPFVFEDFPLQMRIEEFSMMLGDFYAAGHEDIKTCPKLLSAFNGIMGSDESVMLKAIFGTNDDANDTLYWLRVAAVVITGI